MSDTEARPVDERRDAVNRVIATLAEGAIDGGVNRETLREALDREGQSLVDLPEVGLWMALTQVSIIGDPITSTPGLDFPMRTLFEVSIDLRDDVPIGGRRLEWVETTPLSADDVDLALTPPAMFGTGPIPVDSSGVIDFDAIEVVAVEKVIEPPLAEPYDTTLQDGIEPGPPPKGPAASQALPLRSGEGRRIGRLTRLVRVVVRLTSRRPAIEVSVAEPALTGPDNREPDNSESGASESNIADEVARQRAVLDGVLAVGLADPTRPGGALPDLSLSPFVVRRIRQLTDWLHTATSLPDDLGDLGIARRANGTAVPEPYWSPPVVQWITSLDEYLVSSLESVRLFPGSTTAIVPTGSTLEPYWPRPLVHRLAALSAFLHTGLPMVTRLRLGPISPTLEGGARPEPYWPRHLRRAATATQLAIMADREPRTAAALEADLVQALAEVDLIGEIDIEANAPEIEIALMDLMRSQPLDRVGRNHPATLAAYLVLQTGLYPDPVAFDESVPLRALRRTNQVGLAFSEALVRLEKPVFREIEQREGLDHRTRYQRRMELHRGIVGDELETVMAEVRSSWRGGARTGTDVASDWLAARTTISAALGSRLFRLLAFTDHGARVLGSLVELMVVHQPGERRPHTRGLPTSLADEVWAWLDVNRGPVDDVVGVERPRLRLDPTGSGPELVLPTSSARWHLNGELLTYGSPTHAKVVPLPPTRSGRWSLTMDTSSRRSRSDVSFRSAAPERLVLIFDETGRHHHHVLRLRGSRVTIVASSGTGVAGEVGRRPLTGRWAGYEQIESQLTGVDRLAVTHRESVLVDLGVESDLGVRFVASPLPHLEGPRGEPVIENAPRIAFVGHVPPADQVTVSVTDEAGRRQSGLAQLPGPDARGTFGIEQLFDRDERRVVTVSVNCLGSASAQAEFVHAPPASPPIASPMAALELDDQWRVRPALAAAQDRFDLTGPPSRDLALVLARWERWCGWRPPSGPAGVEDALGRLLRPVVEALEGAPRRTAEPGPRRLQTVRLALLDREGWDHAAGDAALLDEWASRHRRPIRRWTDGRASLRNLEPLWSRFDLNAHSRVLVPLIAAALLSVELGPNRTPAAERAEQAHEIAPALSESAAVFAVAYAQVRRLDPPSRFRPIRL